MIYDKYIDTFLYLIIYFSSIFSVAGFGLILDQQIFKSNFTKQSLTRSVFSLYMLGLPLLMVIGFLTYISVGYNKYLNFFILIIGFFIFFKNCKINRKIFLIPSILFIGILISKSHTDFQYYHFQHLNELVSSKFNLGLGNLALRYGNSSLFSYVQGIFYLPFFDLRLFHLPGYLIFVSLVSYLFEKKSYIKNKEIIYFFCFILILLPFQFNRLSEFGYDYISQFILIFLFAEYYLEKKDKGNYLQFSKLLMHFFFSICIKITSIFFFPVILFIFLQNKIYEQKFYYKNIKGFFFITFLIIIFFSTSFIKTGCVFYAFESTCFKNNVTWSVPYEKINGEKNFAKLWAKSYFHQGHEEKIPEKLYITKFKWVKNWIDKHFFYKISEYLYRILFVFFLIYFLCFQNKQIKKKSKHDLYYSLSGLAGSIIWFLYLPQFRFGFATILVSIYFFLSYLFPFKKNINYKMLNILIVISFSFFLYKNIIRINNNFEKDSFYNFNSFPWYKLPERNFKKIYNNDTDSYYIPDESKKDFITNGIGYYCWNIPTPCSENKKNINIKKYYFFTVIKEL